MTESEISESRQISAQLQEMEFRLAYWRKNLEVCEQIVAKIEDKRHELRIRQNALIAGKALGASG